jgi:hypothetical protein
MHLYAFDQFKRDAADYSHVIMKKSDPLRDEIGCGGAAKTASALNE